MMVHLLAVVVRGKVVQLWGDALPVAVDTSLLLLV